VAILAKNAKPNSIPKDNILKGVILKDSALPTPISDFKTGLIKIICCLTRTH